jgi:hypothetical protein
MALAEQARRKVLTTTGARVLEDGVSIPRAHERIRPDGASSVTTCAPSK